MAEILCVEDSPDVLEVLSATLNEHHLYFARSLREACEFLKRRSYSLILLDIELPDGSGFDLLNESQCQFGASPILCLTGKEDFPSKVLAFSMGVEDFILKPFDPRELKLRVESRLKKKSQAEKARDVFRAGDLVFAIEEHCVRKEGDDRPIDLTKYEFRVLCLLARNTNKIYSRSEILDRVWTDSVSVSERTVDVHVSNLRRKILGSMLSIETVIGGGYRAAVLVKVKITQGKSLGPSGPQC